MRAPLLHIWQTWALQWAKLGPQQGERERMLCIGCVLVGIPAHVVFG
jgi:hypothetical protein